MCTWFSGIADENGKQYFGKGGEQSHTEIETQHGLRDDGHGPEYAKWEYYPGPQATALDDFEHFEFRLDEQSTPPWWNAGYQADVIAQAQREIKRQIKRGLHIGRNLCHCPGLTSLPEGITIGSNLCHCPGLTSLPEGITIGKSLSDCPGLTSLPEGITIGSNLCHCPGLTSLPEGITIGGNLFDCPGLKRE